MKKRYFFRVCIIGLLNIVIFLSLISPYIQPGIWTKYPNAKEHGLHSPLLPCSKTLEESIDANTASSGPVTSLPWEDTDRFKEAQKASDTSVLMAAYRTVLRDPLPGEEYNVHLAADMLAGIVVAPGEVFSQNQRIGPYTESRGFKKGPTYMGSQLTTTVGGGVCKIASTLYNVTILSNLQVVERHNHGMPVPYVPYGQDATVAYGALDFKFKNNTSHPVLIWAQGIDNILYIAFYSRAKPPKVEWHHEVLHVQKAPVIYRKSPDLEPGVEKTALEGMDGAVVKSGVEGTVLLTQRFF